MLWGGLFLFMKPGVICFMTFRTNWRQIFYRLLAKCRPVGHQQDALDTCVRSAHNQNRAV